MHYVCLVPLWPVLQHDGFLPPLLMQLCHVGCFILFGFQTELLILYSSTRSEARSENPPLLAADNFPNKFSLDQVCQFLVEDRLIKERHIHLLIARHFDFVSQFDMDENPFVI